MNPDILFDRRASDTLMDVLSAPGPLNGLIQRCLSNRTLLDVQLRREPKGARSWASLYVGLTTVLSVDELNSKFRLRAHKHYVATAGFDDAWREWSDLAGLIHRWPAVEAYLDRAERSAPKALKQTEGVVHAAIAACSSPAYRVVNREVSPAFASVTKRSEICAIIADPIERAIVDAAEGQPWWPSIRNHGKLPHLGTSCDFLAVNAERVLAIEAKPASALQGIVWGPAQVRFYAELLALWLRSDPAGLGCIETMLEQRVALGLSAGGSLRLGRPPVVVPVLAIGAGAASAQARSRMRAVASALDTCLGDAGVAPLEVWRLDIAGVPAERWL